MPPKVKVKVTGVPCRTAEGETCLVNCASGSPQMISSRGRPALSQSPAREPVRYLLVFRSVAES